MALKLSDAIGTLTSFEDLKKYMRQGNDFCRDVASIVSDRVKLEMAYTDGLAKLGVRARKVTGDTLGTMKNSWECFASQCELEAEARKTVSGDLQEQIVKPFKTFIDSHKESKKQAELAVEKAGKALMDKKSDEIKAKKASFNRAKESESLTVQLESTRGKAANEKELSKLDSKCKKAEENVQKSDNEHIGKVIEAERARLSLSSVLFNTCSELQAIEQERINYVKNMLKVYAEFLKESIPKAIQCYDDVYNSAENINVNSDIQSLIKVKGSERQPGEQVMFTCYESDLNNSMDSKRRKLALEHKYEHLDRVLRKEKKARSGLAKLASVYQETPKFSDAGTVDDVSSQIAHANSVIDCLDASLHHIASSLATLNGFEQSQHRLSDCIQKTKDKQNLPLLLLKVPFDRVTVGIPEEGDYEDIGPTQYYEQQYESDEFEDLEDQASPPAYLHNQPSDGYAESQTVAQDYSMAPGRPEIWRALYEYTAAHEDELTIEPGDVINVISKSDGGWWQGELKGATGLFPANYVEQI